LKPFASLALSITTAVPKGISAFLRRLNHPKAISYQRKQTRNNSLYEIW